jgi:pilus assembly protein CpaE
MTMNYMFKASRGAQDGHPAPALVGAVAFRPDDAVTRDPAIPPRPGPATASKTPSKAGPTRNLPVPWHAPASRLILVAKSRGGVGATSVAVNLALELQGTRRLFGPDNTARVALLDFDVQFGNVASYLDLVDRGGMLGLLRLADEPDAQAVRTAMLSHPSGLKVLAAPAKAVPLEALDAARIEAIVAALLAEFDYVVADLPPALVPWLEPLLVRASRLLMVSNLAVPSVTGTRRMLDLMREDNPDLVAEVVVSRERKPMIQRRAHREAETALGLPLSHWLPDEPALSRQALDRGEPLSLLAPRCAWAKSVRQIAASIRSMPPVEARA